MVQTPRIYPWLQESWASTLSCLPIRTLWLDTPLALSDDMERRLSRIDNDNRMCHSDLQQNLEDMVHRTWTSGNDSLQRIYMFFGYDEGLDLGDGMVCTGYRFRLMKLSSGSWGIVDIGAWSESPVISTFLGPLYRPFDDLPGILPDDIDHFPEDYV